jgi:hypothetical protein
MAKSTTIKDVISKSVEIGDEFQELAIKKRDINAAKVANQSYTNAVRALMTQVAYKKLTGAPMKVPFLED